MSKIEVNQISSQCGSTLTIGQSGDTVTLACGATQTGFGRTGTVNWDTTAKTASFTAVSGTGYFVNTTSTAITVTLPAGSAGSIVSLKDYANTWQTNNVTVTPNGTDKINGTNANATLDTQDQSVTLVYVDSTKGWRVVQDSTSDVSGALFITATGGTVTCCGDYKVHTFTGPGTFTVTCAGNAGGSNSVDYLVVAGGGGGGQVTEGGAGGGAAGGFRVSNATCMPAPLTSPLANASGLPVTVTGYPISVGGGGTGGTNGRHPAGNVNGTNGSNSIFSTITSSGGGFGGGGDFPYPGTSATPGNPGGSGGGGHAYTTGAGGTGKGTGNIPTVTPAQGNDGALGVASDSDADAQNGGGGGGAGAAGAQASPTSPGAATYTGGAGGIGSFVVSAGFAGCNGTTGPVCGARYFAGGGGGGRRSAPPTGTAGTGGDGGGADGQNGNVNATADSGTANTGGGGGAGGRGEISPTSPSGGNGGAGGSGIVIIRYKYQ